MREAWLSAVAFGELSTYAYLGASGELAVTPDFGASVFFEFYTDTTEADELGQGGGRRWTLLQMGTDLVWYPLSEFKGLRLGVEGSYLAGRATGPARSGANLGTLLGYKSISGTGFTFMCDTGLGYRVSTPDVQSTLGGGIYFLARLGLGWSFRR